MSSKESSGKTCTHADSRLLEGFQAKQREATGELYTLQEAGSFPDSGLGYRLS